MTFALALGFSATAALWLCLYTAWLDGLLLDVVVRCLGGRIDVITTSHAKELLDG